ncbi:Ig-like domain-containing protein [Massilia sp. CCM 9210]|uniref:Ig-like domain-containing protein n=1 Tax=Massilia scottii TaxID=3057166 RepID=UPI002796BD67|nr:Ig-like domain-containing protein [Massilia sp. CCM 9210]MDQ1814653.1 Ig-like domain-containing protein [Massilia sp. CCM 9210]
MLPTYLQRAFANPVRLLTCVSMATALAACGGGGGSPGGQTSTTNPGTTNPGTTPPGTVTPVPTEPKMTLQLVDAAGAPITTLSGGQTGQVRATVVNANGSVAVNEVVKFKTDDKLLQFTPESATALTNASGIAIITVKPASVTAAGAVNIAATVVASGKTAEAGVNLEVGAAPLTLGEVKFTPEQTDILPAFGTAVLTIPVTTGGVGATSVPGLAVNSLCAGDGTASLVLGSLADGKQLVTYTNKGCLRVTDTITVTLGTSSQTIKINVGKANIGTIQFVGSDLNGSSIVLRGSGGLGRKESAILTFRVLDQNSIGLPGVDVTFKTTTSTGGLIVQPTKATSDAQGNVTTTVASGTIPTPVRIVAQASRNGTTINGLSDSLIISTGLPIQKSMSLSADSYNIEGWNYDNAIAKVTVMLADQYGNPISDDTAVNLVTEGGAIAASEIGGCRTKGGGCTVDFKSQAFRPTNGRVTVLAYVQGVENFTDTNGDGQYSCTNFDQVQPVEPGTPYRPLVDYCKPGSGEPYTDQGDPFLDTGTEPVVLGNPKGNVGTLDGKYDVPRFDLPFPYNRTVYSTAGNGQWGINYIWRETEIVFSGETPTFTRQIVDATSGELRDWTAADGKEYEVVGLSGKDCGNQFIYFRIADVNNNPLPSGTSLESSDVDRVVPGAISPSKVPATSRIGGTQHTVNVKADSTCVDGEFSIRTTTPRGNAFSSKIFKSVAKP